jgi:polyphenol oxidase
MGHKIDSYGGIGWVGPPTGWFPEAHAAVSLRTGGVSRPPFGSLNLGRSAGDDLLCVAENEKRLTGALHLPDGLARARLEHGTRCVVVEAPGSYDPCDGLATSREGLPLYLTVGDCVPLFATAGEWIGLMHCGWRGTVEGGVGRFLETLERVSSIPTEKQRVWIGPGIGVCCYPVGAEVADRFPPETVRREGSEARLDLPAAIRSHLRIAGLPDSRIDGCSLCTSCRPDLFFSYRRDGLRSGRMAAVIWR